MFENIYCQNCQIKNYNCKCDDDPEIIKHMKSLLLLTFNKIKKLYVDGEIHRFKIEYLNIVNLSYQSKQISINELNLLMGKRLVHFKDSKLINPTGTINDVNGKIYFIEITDLIVLDEECVIEFKLPNKEVCPETIYNGSLFINSRIVDNCC
jgi:hypothetical protein